VVTQYGRETGNAILELGDWFIRNAQAIPAEAREYAKKMENNFDPKQEPAKKVEDKIKALMKLLEKARSGAKRGASNAVKQHKAKRKRATYSPYKKKKKKYSFY